MFNYNYSFAFGIVFPFKISRSKNAQYGFLLGNVFNFVWRIQFSFILRVCIQMLKFHNKCLRDWNLSMSLLHKGKKHMLLYLPLPNGRDAPFSLNNMKTTTWIIHYDFECDCEVYRCPHMDGLKIVWSYITCSQREYNHLAIMCMPKRWILRVVQLQLPNGDLWIVWTKLLVFMPIQSQSKPW
jgi:hypothetical protein